MRPSAIVFSLAWLMAGAPTPAGPAPSPPPPLGAALYVLRYRTTAGCPTEDRMRADVGAHLRQGIRPSGVEIEIQLAGTAGQFTGQLLATDRFGAEDRQSLSGADCSEIARALAFLAGLAVELGERRQAELVRAAPPASDQRPPPAPPPPHAFRIAGRILAGATGGLADGPSLLGEVGVAVEDTRPRFFAPAFVGALLVAGENQIEGRRGSAELSLLGGRLAVCPVRLSRIEGRAPPLRRLHVRGGQRTGDQPARIHPPSPSPGSRPRPPWRFAGSSRRRSSPRWKEERFSRSSGRVTPSRFSPTPSRSTRCHGSPGGSPPGSAFVFDAEAVIVCPNPRPILQVMESVSRPAPTSLPRESARAQRDARGPRARRQSFRFGLAGAEAAGRARSGHRRCGPTGVPGRVAPARRDRSAGERPYLLGVALRVAADARRALLRRREVPMDETAEMAMIGGPAGPTLEDSWMRSRPWVARRAPGAPPGRDAGGLRPLRARSSSRPPRWPICSASRWGRSPPACGERATRFDNTSSESEARREQASPLGRRGGDRRGASAPRGGTS